jgi:hypothetical protein
VSETRLSAGAGPLSHFIFTSNQKSSWMGAAGHGLPCIVTVHIFSFDGSIPSISQDADRQSAGIEKGAGPAQHKKLAIGEKIIGIEGLAPCAGTE